MMSFFVIASFRLEKSNFQVFVLNSSSQFPGIKKKAWVNMFNMHFKNKPREKIVYFKIQLNILTAHISVNLSDVSSSFVIGLHPKNPYHSESFIEVHHFWEKR